MVRLIIFAFVMITLAGPCVAEEQFSKDWFWDVSGEEFVYAGTKNGEGRLLGQFCYYSMGSCLYLVSLGINCEQGEKYSSIVNSDSGASGVQLICSEKADNENLMIIDAFDLIDNMVKEADNIGFAVPMKDGRFKVVRFSLSGSNHAIEMMRLGAEIISGARSSGEQKVKREEYL
jgi:hypothetical protein